MIPLKNVVRPKYTGLPFGTIARLSTLPVGTCIRGDGWSASWRIIRKLGHTELKLVNLTSGGRSPIGHETTFAFAEDLRVTVVGPNGEREVAYDQT
jgi:hypothetical protein